MTSATAALELLAQVKASAHAAIPVEPPALYLGRLKKRLEAIAAGNIRQRRSDSNKYAHQ